MAVKTMRYKGFALNRNDAGMWEASAYRIRLGPYGSVEVLRAAIDQQRPDVLSAVPGQREGLQKLVAVGLVQKPTDPACIVVEQDELIKLDAATLARLRAAGGSSGFVEPIAQLFQDGRLVHTQYPYTMHDQIADAWRNRPNADEDLFDAPVVEPYSPRKRMAIWLLAFPLAWAALGLLAVFLTNMFAWVFSAPVPVAIVAAALSLCAGFLLIMWVRR